MRRLVSKEDLVKTFLGYNPVVKLGNLACRQKTTPSPSIRIEAALSVRVSDTGKPTREPKQRMWLRLAMCCEKMPADEEEKDCSDERMSVCYAEREDLPLPPAGCTFHTVFLQRVTPPPKRVLVLVREACSFLFLFQAVKCKHQAQT